MSRVPARVAERLTTGIKRFQPILASARARDVNESDTVILVTDMLADIFGYDKYTEITSECAIRGTWCDLAIKQDGKFLLLIEVKAIGSELKEMQTKQAVDYASNQGVDWVVLTNAETWRVYKLTFGKPISSELVLELNLSQMQPRRDADAEMMYHPSERHPSRRHRRRARPDRAASPRSLGRRAPSGRYRSIGKDCSCTSNTSSSAAPQIEALRCRV